LDKKEFIKSSDEELVVGYRQTGEKEMVGELFKRYTHFVFCVCFKYLQNENDSRDAVMQIFERLFDQLRIHEVETFRKWLHVVAKNHCLMKLRADKSQRTRLQGYQKDNNMDVKSVPFLHPEDSPDKETEIRKLESAIEQLNEEQKICIELFYLYDKSYVEVSQETGFSLKQVKSFIQNGKRNLKINIIRNHERLDQ
jgi:RNA polymerase sigma factor (sigma-70 family)